MCIFIYFIYAALMVELLFCCIEASSFLFMQLFKDCFIVLYFYGVHICCHIWSAQRLHFSLMGMDGLQYLNKWISDLISINLLTSSN